MNGSGDVLIIGATVVTVDPHDRVLMDAAIGIRDGIITHLGEGEMGAVDWAQVIDAHGRVVIPGFVNCHTHSAFSLARGLEPELPLGPWLEYVFAISDVIGPDEARAGATLAYLEMLESGITTCVDHHYAQAHADNAVAVAEASCRAGLRVCLAPTPVGGHGHGRQLMAIDSVISTSRGDLVDLWVGLASPIRRESPEDCRAARQLARDRDTRVTYHFAESRDWYTLLDNLPAATAAGFAGLLNDLDLLGPEVLLSHGVWLSAADLEQLAATNTAISHNPVSNMYLADGVAPVVAMRGAGIRVGLGTDAANCNHRCDPFETMKMAALLQKVTALDAGVATARDALRMATIEGAEALGLDDRVGSIEVGKQADLVVVDFDRPHLVPNHDPVANLVYAAGPDDVDVVIVGGRVVVEHGKAVGRDRARILADAVDAAAKVGAASAPVRAAIAQRSPPPRRTGEAQARVARASLTSPAPEVGEAGENEGS